MRCCKAIERVDCRAPKVGREGAVLVVAPEGLMVLLSSSEGSASVLTAGDAGIVLKRFLPSATPALRREDVMGLVLVRCVVFGAVRAAGVAGVLVVFVGLRVLARPTGFLSEVGEGWIVDLLSGVAELAFVVEVRPIVLPANDILLAGFPRLVFFFSSPDAPDLVPSSFEASEGRALCVLPMVVVAGAVFRTAVLLVGLAGGLFSVLPAVDRAAVVLVVFMKEGVLVGVAFTPVNGRFGGTAALVTGSLFATVDSSTEGISSVAAMMKILYRQI